MKLPHKKITVVCQVFYPDSQATSQLFTCLFKKLVERGYEIEVLSGFPATVLGEGNEDSFLSDVSVFGIRVKRSGGRFNFKKNLFLRMCHYMLYMCGTTFKLCKARFRSNFVFGVTNPPFTPVWLWLCHKLLRFKYEIMLLDVYPDGLVRLGKMKESSLIAKLWRWGNKQAFHCANKVIVIGRDMAELANEVYGVRNEDIEYIPHWSAVEPELPKLPEETNLWKELRLNGEFVVQYSGNMGLWHDIETLVYTANILKSVSSIRFLFIGDGRRAVAAKRISENLGCQNITWLPFQPQEKLEDSLACCHLSIISQREGLQGIAVPCKLYGILSSGRGILGMVPEEAEVARVIAEERCGVINIPGDYNSLAKEIFRLSSLRDEVMEMGTRSFEAYNQKYTLDVAARSFDRHWSR